MILSYSIISSILLGCGYLAYRFTMAGQRQHKLNRQAMLTIYGISLVLPLAMLAIMFRHPETAAGFQIEVGEITSTLVEGSHETENRGIDLVETVSIAYIVYVIGLIVCAAYFGFGLLMLGRVISKGKRTEFGTFSLYL